MKALKVKVSGSYTAESGEIVDFDDIEGIIPFTTEERAIASVRRRFAGEWVATAKDGDGERIYKKRISKPRQVFIDGIEEVDHDFSFIGKDIKEMTYPELQDLAVHKSLRYIPLPQRFSGFDLREARKRAYLAYKDKVLGEPIDTKKPPLAMSTQKTNPDGSTYLELEYAKFPPIVVDADLRIETSKAVTNDEIIENEAHVMQSGKVTNPWDAYEIEELKKSADDKGLSYHPNIGKEKLYKLIYC